MTRPSLPLDSPVSQTVYSALWPETETLMRQCMLDETEAMLMRHRDAHTKQQDRMHDSFFTAWKEFAAPIAQWRDDQFPEQYPCAGSSEAIREVIRMAVWNQQDLVVFDGDYEGYDAMAAMQGTRIHRVDRTRWRETLEQWRSEGVPWRGKAQWWISQPSALDGNVWADFSAWLTFVDQINANQSSSAISVWLDLCYLGVTTKPWHVDVRNHAAVAGVVFSLSKVMGAYYRRIGGCFSREPLPGLWGNRWFKNLDSLYLGERWMREVGADHTARQALLAQRQAAALNTLNLGTAWRASDVALLAYADPDADGPLSDDLAQFRWAASQRGQDERHPAARRLCLTPTLIPNETGPDLVA